MLSILLVEDDVYLREIYETQLAQDLNCKVSVAFSGNEAIHLLQENTSFNLIISDYSMPNGTGLDLLGYLEKNKANIPFYFYTGTIDLEVKTIYPVYKGLIHKFNYTELISRILKDCSKEVL
ncbi:MAG: response regulator [Bacteriovoracia bacterium]